MGTKADKEKEYRVSELIDMGFKHIQWDGSTPVPIVDCCGRIIAVLAGQLDGNYASELHAERSIPFGTWERVEGGPTQTWSIPSLALGHNDTHLLNRLVGHTAVQCMAKYQNSAFGLWAPRIYEEYQNVHDTMHSKLNLPESFPGTIFAAAAFNLGGNVWTFKHRDWLNWLFGWCAITALGEFDASQSAQLILWELKLVIDFPHAATILIPSVVITHSNTPIADGDIRTC
ncbi:hypothetical protein GG344DRAFT_84161 [Lentinula edodes]|nr:hypothetical protein GG344DRAFT_84161 [Lentinula edodes]